MNLCKEVAREDREENIQFTQIWSQCTENVDTLLNHFAYDLWIDVLAAY